MEAQDIFNVVVRHLLTQNARSYLEDGIGCAYRGDEGRKCAAGILLTDEEAAACGEGWVWPEEDDLGDGNDPAIEAADRIGHHSLVRQLQWVHDTWTPFEWPQELARVATNFGLDTSALEEVKP